MEFALTALPLLLKDEEEREADVGGSPEKVAGRQALTPETKFGGLIGDIVAGGQFQLLLVTRTARYAATSQLSTSTPTF